MRRVGRILALSWRRSLQFRAVVSTMVVTVLVVGIAGFVLVQRVDSGLMENKRHTALAEAAAGRSIARTFAGTVPDTDANTIIADLVEALAGRAGKPPAFDVVVEAAPHTGLPSAATELASITSVPEPLVAALRDEQRTVWMYGDVRYADGRVEPALVVGTPVNIRGIGPYELYYLFDLTDVTRTTAIVRSTVVGVGLVLVLGLGAMASALSGRLVRPVQQLSRTAAALSAGDLDRRARVRGEDDVARLSASFNTMADNLQEQIEQLRRLSEMQRRFVADVSHELRTPLTTIRMAADLVESSAESGQPLPPRTAELLAAEVDRFDTLLNDLLEVSRYDAGEVVLEPEELDLVWLVGETLQALRPVAAEHGCELLVGGAHECPVRCDPRRIRRIIRNLVVNAIEHGAGEPVEVIVDTHPDTVSVSIIDHGVGLDPADADRVFERFWRADPARKRTLGGSGLGLAISREDARLHGGDITVLGAPGAGCTFTLTLPRQ